MRRSPVLLAALLALMLAALPVTAGAAPRVSGLPDRALVAGETLELRWEGVAPGTDELEVLLSVDGGEHYALRVSPACEPARGGWRWRVPDVVTSHARLRVRYGCGHGEALGPPTAEFAIQPRPDAPHRVLIAPARPAEPRVHEAGWWQPGDADGAPFAPASLAGPRLVARAPGEADADTDPALADGAEQDGATCALARAGAPTRPSLPPHESPTSRWRPRRE